MVDKIHVSPAVFRKAVNDEEHGFRFGFREPILVIDPVIPHAVEKPFLVFHDPSSFRPSGRVRCPNCTVTSHSHRDLICILLELDKSSFLLPLSFLRKQESSPFNAFWIPAFAGMTIRGYFSKASHQVSTQFRERSSARLHPRVSRSTFSVSIFGRNLFSTGTRWLISSTPFQQPTARPAR